MTVTHDAEKASIASAAKDPTNVAVVEKAREELNVSPEDDARVRRRVDWILLPYLMAVYGLQFLDKTAMTYASVMGFRESNALTLSQYSWLSSIFYLGYIVGAYPMVLLQQRLPLAIFTGANITIWGGVLCFMAVAKGFAGLMVVRFFLGFVSRLEGRLTPVRELDRASAHALHGHVVQEDRAGLAHRPVDGV